MRRKLTMKKLLYVLSLLIIASMVLAACGGGGAAEEPTAPAEPVQIRWFVGLGTGTDPEQVAIQEEVVADFNASQDKIELVLEIVPYDSARDTLSTQIASGAGPDIVGPVGWGGSNDFYGQWLDIAPYIQSSGFDTSVFDPALVKFYQTEEGQIGLPFAVFPGAMYFVPAMFDEAGLNYPPQVYGEKYVFPDGREADWNWETVTEVAKLLTVDVNGLNATEEGFDRTQIVQVGYNPSGSPSSRSVHSMAAPPSSTPAMPRVPLLPPSPTAGRQAGNGTMKACGAMSPSLRPALFPERLNLALVTSSTPVKPPWA
jgi:multiple sugar transport system substrate-binding protein